MLCRCVVKAFDIYIIPPFDCEEGVVALFYNICFDGLKVGKVVPFNGSNISSSENFFTRIMYPGANGFFFFFLFDYFIFSLVLISKVNPQAFIASHPAHQVTLFACTGAVDCFSTFAFLLGESYNFVDYIMRKANLGCCFLCFCRNSKCCKESAFVHFELFFAITFSEKRLF